MPRTVTQPQPWRAELIWKGYTVPLITEARYEIPHGEREMMGEVWTPGHHITPGAAESSPVGGGSSLAAPEGQTTIPGTAEDMELEGRIWFPGGHTEVRQLRCR